MDHLIGLMQKQHGVFASRDIMLDLAQSDKKSKANILLWLSIQWWLSSYTMALAELCERCGEIITALHFARYSCILSQNAVKMTREKVVNSTLLDYSLDVHWLGMPTLFPPFSSSKNKSLVDLWTRTIQPNHSCGRKRS